MNEVTNGTMEDQLEALYAERDWLQQEIGASDAESIVDMVRSLESQLNDLYQTYGNLPATGNPATFQLLQTVQELSQHVESQYPTKTVTFELAGDKPVIKAEWKASTQNTQGDNQ